MKSNFRKRKQQRVLVVSDTTFNIKVDCLAITIKRYFQMKRRAKQFVVETANGGYPV